MLPGFRFLFGAILLTLSLMIFGLGAAALLRAAHQEFASLPSRPAPPQPDFAALSDAAMPSLAMLRIEAPATDAEAAEETSPNAIETAAPPAEPSIATATAPAEKEPAKIDLPEAVASTVEEPQQPELHGPETRASETMVRAELAADNDDVTSVIETPAAANASPATAPLSPANAPEQAGSATVSNGISTKIATLGGPAVEIGTPASPARVRPIARRAEVKKRPPAARVVARRKIVKRTRVVRRAPQTTTDPFGTASQFGGFPGASSRSP